MTQIINITPNSRDAEFVALTNSELYLEVKRIREALESLKAPAATPSAPDTPTTAAATAATAAPEQTPSAPNPETAAQIQQLEARLNEVLTQLREQAQTLEDKPDEQAVINLFNKAVQNLPQTQNNAPLQFYLPELSPNKQEVALKGYEIELSKEKGVNTVITLPDNFPLGRTMVWYNQRPNFIDIQQRRFDVKDYGLYSADAVMFFLPINADAHIATYDEKVTFRKKLNASKIHDIAVSARGFFSGMGDGMDDDYTVELTDFEIIVSVEDDDGSVIEVDGAEYADWSVAALGSDDAAELHFNRENKPYTYVWSDNPIIAGETKAFYILPFGMRTSEAKDKWVFNVDIERYSGE